MEEDIPLSPEEAQLALATGESWGHETIDNRQGEFLRAVRNGEIILHYGYAGRVPEGASKQPVLTPVKRKRNPSPDKPYIGARDTLLWEGRELTISEWAKEEGQRLETMKNRVRMWAMGELSSPFSHGRYMRRKTDK